MNWGENQGAESGRTADAGPVERADSGTTVTIDYFASFRDDRGLSSERIETFSRTLGELYRELSDAHNLRYDPDSVRVARNDEFASWEDPLSEGDRVVFLAPFGGG